MKYPTTWNFKLLYKSGTDPQIEKDLKAIERAFAGFEKKYKGKDFISTPAKLLRALKDYYKVEKILNNHKPWWYFALHKDLDSDTGYESKTTSYQQRINQASNKATFFKITLGKVPPKQQRTLLADKSLAGYKYLLKSTFEHSKYNLTEGEEQLAQLLAQPGYSMWIDGQKKLLSRQLVSYKSKKLPFEEAVGILAEQSPKDRVVLNAEMNNVLKSISHFAEAEINAIYNFKKIMDERRGFKKPYSETVLNYENTEKTVEKLVSTVTKHFDISKRFYKLHAKLLGKKKLSIADRAVTIGKINKQFDFKSSAELVKKCVEKVDRKYRVIFEGFLRRGQIDVYPRQGKKGGAYCWGGKGAIPTFVFLNHTGSVRSVETLAHEMGHAFHTELMKSQPLHYQGYSTATAEVASTFFEQLVGEELEKGLAESERAVLLHNRLMGDMATIFRQIAFFNFELELHERIRKEGQLSKEEMAKLMNKHFKSYFGPAVEVNENDGYFYVHLSHMRRFFYVYSYAFGLLVSRALFTKWKKNPAYAKQIESFLKAGHSMSPENIFKSIGIDVSDPKFFESGLKAIEEDIAKLERLTRKKK